MELTIEQALQRGVAAHKEGNLQEAEKFYRAILQSQPQHPDANHNLGILAVSFNKIDIALPLFKNAVEANPKIEQFWLSYIDAFIKDKQFNNAGRILEQAIQQGIDSRIFASSKRQIISKLPDEGSNSASPTKRQISDLLDLYQNGRYDDAKTLALSLTEMFPKHPFGWKVLGTILGLKRKHSEAVVANKTATKLAPQDNVIHFNLANSLREIGKLKEAEASYLIAISIDSNFFEAHMNLGTTLHSLARLEEAVISFRNAIRINSDYAPAYNNLGITLKSLGKLDEAEASYMKALSIKLDYAEAHNNLGNTLSEQGRLEEAEGSYKQAIKYNPNFAEAYWNIHGLQKSKEKAEHWIDKCLQADKTFFKARLTKAALRFYQGQRDTFDALIKTSLKQDPYMRSFSWVFNLPKLPELRFDKWDFFDFVIKKSDTSRPFYEFGVWRASSFKYLMQTFKSGFGFDTFTGLPEDWDVGTKIEPIGAYSSDGSIPRIAGAEFIKGRFEDTLPTFFSKRRPHASIINFDADLYSSTIFALNLSRPIIDQDTILIFDELIMHESWEQDEFRALSEFCSNNAFTYEVLAVSFFSKQVAVKLTGF